MTIKLKSFTAKPWHLLYIKGNKYTNILTGYPEAKETGFHVFKYSESVLEYWSLRWRFSVVVWMYEYEEL